MSAPLPNCSSNVVLIKDGGPAFPVVGMDQRGEQQFSAVFNGGMTLRDYFAAHASEKDIEFHRTGPSREAARYAFADSMLAARKKKP